MFRSLGDQGEEAMGKASSSQKKGGRKKGEKKPLPSGGCYPRGLFVFNTLLLKKINRVIIPL